MKQFRSAVLILFSVIVVFAVIVNGNTAAWFASSDQLTAHFTAADDFGGSSLQENLDRIIKDLLLEGVLVGAHQNFFHKNSWSYRIQAYVSGGSSTSNIYDFENPVSGKRNVLRALAVWGGVDDWRPMLFITNNPTFSHENIEANDQFSRLFGSLIMYKPNGNNRPMEYYTIDEDGALGPLNTLSPSEVGNGKSDPGEDGVKTEILDPAAVTEKEAEASEPDPQEAVDEGGEAEDALSSEEEKEGEGMNGDPGDPVEPEEAPQEDEDADHGDPLGENGEEDEGVNNEAGEEQNPPDEDGNSEAGAPDQGEEGAE